MGGWIIPLSFINASLQTNVKRSVGCPKVHDPLCLLVQLFWGKFGFYRAGC